MTDVVHKGHGGGDGGNNTTFCVRLTGNYYRPGLMSGLTFMCYQNSRRSQNNITTKMEL